MPVQPLLEVRGLSVAYGPAQALSQVDLSVSAGGAVAVLGTTGAGKSSLAKAVCALVPASAGTNTSAARTSLGAHPAR